MIFAAFLAMSVIGSSASAAEAEPPRKIVVGVRAHMGVLEAIRRWQPTIDYLNERIAGARFVLRPYATPDAVESAAAADDFDFIITDPGSFVRTEVHHGVKSLLSLVASWQGRPVRRFGSVIFTRKERADILTLGDLRGRTLMAVAPEGFGGWLMAKEEFFERGLVPERHLKRILFAGGDQRRVVRAVREGWVDAGVVRTGVLERMAAEGHIKLSDFHVIAPRSVPDFPFLLSSDLYPEWVFAASPTAPEGYRAAVVDALRALQPDSRPARAGSYLGWTLPLDYWPVHVLYQHLKVDPYEDYGEVTLADAAWENRYWLVLIGSAAIGLLFALVLAVRRERHLARANAELAGLRGSEIEFYRHALDAHAIITATDADGHITHVSDRFLEASGYAREEVIGRTHNFLRSGHHPPEFYAEIWRTIRRGETWTGEICNRRKDGSPWWVQTSIIPKKDATGRIIGYASVRTDVTALKAAQAEMNLREFLECTPGESYKFWARDYRIFMVNSAAQKVTGLAEGEILGRTLFDFLPGEEAGRLRRLLDALGVENREPIIFECERCMPDGRRVPTRFHIQPLWPEGGEPRFLATLHDISGLSRAREEVVHLKDTLDEFAEQIYMFCPETRRFIYVNRAAREWVGLPEEEIFRLTPSDLEGGLSKEECDQLLTPMLEGKREQAVFCREVRMKDGRLRTIEYDVKYLRPAGLSPRFVAILRDVTARRLAEREVRQLKSTLDLIDTEIYMFWPESYEFSYLNRKALKRIGWGEDEWHGKHTYDNITPRQQALLEQRCRQLMEGPERSMVFEYRDREGTPLEIYLHLIEPEGEPPRFISVYRDISERKQAEEAKSQFISTVSHELRTPLTSIKGSLGLLKAGLGKTDPERVASMIDIAHANADRLHRLVDDILDWEKIEAGKMSYRMECHELAAILREAVTVNEGYGRAHGVRFALELPADPVFARLDRDRMAQVLANLLSNAAKFSGDSDTVEVSLDVEDGEAVVSVRDHGIGIPQAGQATIFERFTQADSSDVRKAGGTGLGLSISRAIVEAHGGTMDFESVEGRGTVFRFRLPVLAGGAAAKSAEEEEEQPQGPRVLICEADTELAMDLWLALEQAGCRGHVAPRPAAALRALESESFDALVINASLPGKLGSTLLRRARMDAAEHGCNVILYAPPRDAEEKEHLQQHLVAVLSARLPLVVERPATAPRDTASLGASNWRALAVGDRGADAALAPSLAECGFAVIRAESLAQAAHRLERGLYEVVAFDPSGTAVDWQAALDAFVGRRWPRTRLMVFAGRRREKTGARAAAGRGEPGRSGEGGPGREGAVARASAPAAQRAGRNSRRQTATVAQGTMQGEGNA
ncbi:MAG: PAS domain S-box protein, partial [Alphaproteobacteria bacterium]